MYREDLVKYKYVKIKLPCSMLAVEPRTSLSKCFTFSRHAEQNRVPLEMAPIVIEVLKLLRSWLPTTIEIKQSVKTEAEKVAADPTQVHQIVMNLCTNAAQAVKETASVLEVALSDVELDEDGVGKYPALVPGSYVSLRVSDTGPGMAPEIIDRIFYPYIIAQG
jgi:signal transduction histidine kinase